MYKGKVMVSKEYSIDGYFELGSYDSMDVWIHSILCSKEDKGRQHHSRGLGMHKYIIYFYKTCRLILINPFTPHHPTNPITTVPVRDISTGFLLLEQMKRKMDCLWFEKHLWKDTMEKCDNIII